MKWAILKFDFWHCDSKSHQRNCICRQPEQCVLSMVRKIQWEKSEEIQHSLYFELGSKTPLLFLELYNKETVFQSDVFGSNNTLLGHRIIESQNHSWVGIKSSSLSSPPPPTMLQKGLLIHQIRLLKVSSRWTLKTSREEESTTSLGNLCRYLTTIIVKNVFLISDLNLLSFSLE